MIIPIYTTEVKFWDYALLFQNKAGRGFTMGVLTSRSGKEKTAYRFGKYSFYSESEYQAARRDARKIADLTRSGRSTADIARNYKKQIKDKGIEFESKLGFDFEEGLDNSLFLEPKTASESRRQQASDRLERKKPLQYAKSLKLDDEESLADRFSIDIELSEKSKSRINSFKAGTVIAFTLSFLVVAYALGALVIRDFDSRRRRSELANQIAETDVVSATESAIDVASPLASEKKDPVRVVMPKYQTLHERNSDMAGWLTIPGTNVDYPVMYLEDDNDFYLSHNFDKEYDINGLLVLDKRCNSDASGLNVLIHGHNMDNGDMFGNLDLYKNYDYYKEHSTMEFNSLYETGVYDIIAVFVSSVYNSNVGEFAYYDYINIETENDYNTYVQTAKENSLYDTGLSAEYGDELITLSTCEYSRPNGRLVILGRRRNA